jgi:RsiW-degrading membrane proteinase PrsW (M82 family)
MVWSMKVGMAGRERGDGPISPRRPVGAQPASPGAVPAATADRRGLVLGGACVLLSLVGVVLHVFHAVPVSAAGGIVLAAVALFVRVVMLWSLRTASAQQRARVLGVLAYVGLAIALITLVAALPHITRSAGVGRFVADAFAESWTLLLLFAATAGVRTLPVRAYLGVFFVGTLGTSSLARLVGTPLTRHAAPNDYLVFAGYVPLTEEVLKILPALLVVAFVGRRREARPSAADIMLMGACSGAGFALYEDALFGRGGPHWSAAPPLSLLVPSGRIDEVPGISLFFAGHLIYSALLALGIAVTALYARRSLLCRAAAPLAFAISFGEHATGNALLISGGRVPWWVRLGEYLSLDGWLSTLTLVAGVAWVLRVEWRAATRVPRPHATWLRIRPAEAGRRMRRLAALQHGGPA